MNVSDIDTSTIEGRLLLAALAKLTTESQTDKTPDEVIEQCVMLAEHMFKECSPSAFSSTFANQAKIPDS